MIRVLFTFALALVVLVSIGPEAGAEPATPGLRAVLDRVSPDQEISIIVSFSDRVDPAAFQRETKQDRRRLIIEALRDKAQGSQAGLASFLRARGGRQITELWIRNALAVTAPAAVIDQLETWPGVETIELDEVFQAPTPILSAAAPPEWNIDMIRAPELWAMGHTGQGVVVASMDTGVDIRHDDLKNRWRGGSNSWFDPHRQHVNRPFDADGHGTLTTGVMVGGDATGSAIGVAPGAKWIAVKIFSDQGKAFLSDIEEGFQWLLDPDDDPLTDDAPDIVNNSWSLIGSKGSCNQALLADIRMLRAVEIAVVFAAGNSGSGTSSDTSPANNAGSFAVGAVRQSGSIASFSSRGPSSCDGGIFPHLVAPGVNIKSADLTRGVDFDAFNFVNGTSFASPHNAGAMALLLSAVPDATVSELESDLVGSAVDLGASGPDNTYGNGLLDVAAAIALLDGIVITRARYRVSRDNLVVLATSALGQNADLRAIVRLRDGSRVRRSMSWNSDRRRWQMRLRRFVARFGSRPRSVRVRGPEGAAVRSVRIVR